MYKHDTWVSPNLVFNYRIGWWRLVSRWKNNCQALALFALATTIISLTTIPANKKRKTRSWNLNFTLSLHLTEIWTFFFFNSLPTHTLSHTVTLVSLSSMAEPHSTAAILPPSTARLEETPSGSSQTPLRSGRGGWSIVDGSFAIVRDNTCSCFVVVFSLWFFGKGQPSIFSC